MTVKHKNRIQAFVLLCAAAALARAVQKADWPGSIRIQEEFLQIEGIRRDYDILLIADTHISLCDERDAKLMEKAQARRLAFEQEIRCPHVSQPDYRIREKRHGRYGFCRGYYRLGHAGVH